MTSQTPSIDVIIATRGRGALIVPAIRTVLASSRNSFTLWIVDQSRDHLTEQVAAACAEGDPRLRYLRLDSQGVSIARNAGAAACSGDYLLFTDDDCRISPDWMAEMARELDSAENWAVFGRVLPDGESPAGVRPGGKPVSSAIKIALKDSAERRVYRGDRYNLGFGHGASMGFRRERFEQVGGFDDTLGAGGVFRSWPERDIGYRMLARGGQMVYTPRALVYHRHWRDWDEVRRTYISYGIGAGAAAAKYARCGDRGAWRFIAEWMADQGLRQMLSGALKWRSRQKFEIGLLQLIYPWAGLAGGLRHPIDRRMCKYRVH
jgi:GT2 family glycosyltransferase